MVDVEMPVPASFDDPGFEAFLDDLTAFLNGDPPAPPDTHPETTDLSGRERIAVLQARVRSQSRSQALVYEDIAAIHDSCADVSDPELAWDAAAAEIRAALRLTRRAADHELDIALSLRNRVPMVLEALKQGHVDQRRAVTS